MENGIKVNIEVNEFGYVIFKLPESTLNLYFVLTIINKTCFVIEIFRSLNK